MNKPKSKILKSNEKKFLISYLSIFDNDNIDKYKIPNGIKNRTLNKYLSLNLEVLRLDIKLFNLDVKGT